MYKKSHSVLPSLELRIGDTKGGSPPKSAPPRIRAPSPCFRPIQEPYVDVFVDGACSYNGKGEPRDGIGVWFGPDNPLNISRPVRDRHTNNVAKIKAAVEATRRAQDAGIKKLRINTDSKYLVSSATEWIPTWEKNDWKTAENKPVKNRTKFEQLKRALESIQVIWNYVPGHNGIEGNEAADRLAREGIDAGATPNPEPIEDTNNPGEPSRVIVDVPPLPKGSDESNDDNEVSIVTYDSKKNN